MCEKPSFSKPALTITQQLSLLKTRGMHSSMNDSVAEELLLHNNYYRLEGYWFNYYQAELYPNHIFQENASLEKVFSDYHADSILRHSTFSALEVIEVSFKSVFAYVLAKNHGPFPYSSNDLDCDIDSYLDAMNKLKEDIRHSRDVFLKEFKNHYSNPIPPIWMMVELMSLGEISRWYGDYIYTTDKKEIASYYGVPASVLTSWMHSISTIRNRCAHHNRLYGIFISGGFKIPKNLKDVSYIKLFDNSNRNSVYNMIIAVCYLLDTIGRQTVRKQYVDDIVHIVDVFDIEESKLGFPDGKTAMDLYKEIEEGQNKK